MKSFYAWRLTTVFVKGRALVSVLANSEEEARLLLMRHFIKKEYSYVTDEPVESDLDRIAKKLEWLTDFLGDISSKPNYVLDTYMAPNNGELE